MKNSRLTLTNLLTLFIFAFFAVLGCAPEAEEIPATVDDITTERITYTSEISIGSHTFTKETTVQFTISPDGELLTSEVLSRTLDGVEMERVGDDNWSIAVVTGKNGESQERNPSGMAGTVTESEDCDTDYTLIGVIPNPSPFGPDLCMYSTETTCFRSGYDSNGVYTTVITVEDGYAFATCTPF